MQMLNRQPAAAYRKVELDARIEASGGADLTRICLEEAHAALGQALAAIDRSLQGHSGAVALSRAQTILLWLAGSLAPGHPLYAALRQFYGGLASQIGANIQQPIASTIMQIQNDIRDLLEAAG